MCKKESFKVTSRIDGLELAGLYYEQETDNCRGIIQIVHGMCEHKERYDRIMRYFAEKGFASIIHDKRGHGESVLSPEDLGYMYGGGMDAYIEDILQINEYAREWMPDVPVIMLGHSMGSLGARAFAKVHDDRIDALVLSGSPSKNPALAAGTTVAKLQKKSKGQRHEATFLAKMSFDGYKAKFKDENKEFAWLCSNPEVVDAYEEDPLCGFTFTVDAYLVLFELMKRTYSTKEWACTNPQMPVRFIAGKEDPCIESKDKFVEAVEYMKKVGYKNVSGKLYAGMRHEIFQEREKEKVFAELEDYLTSKGF